MSLPFKKLGLGGGGAKGILHVGALIELSKYQNLYFPEGVYGTSIGAIIAVCIAFQVPITTSFFNDKKDILAIERLVPALTFETLQTGFSGKGMFMMNTFREKMIHTFNSSMSLDLETLKIKDAKMPLYIIASNITKGVPTMFTENITLIDALCCSCCLPFIYRPQELYGQLYIDGDVFLPYIGLLERDAFVISLKTPSYVKITPKTLADIPIHTYIREIYNTGVRCNYNFQKHENTLDLSYPNLVAESDLNDFDIPHILKVSGESLRSFLISKSFLKELPEVLDTRSTNHLK